MSALSLGWSVSSFIACAGAGGFGARAGASHRVGGGPGGAGVRGAPYIPSGAARDNHSHERGLLDDEGIADGVRDAFGE
jgi:hypothetical protein